jgi:hypothetical protein
VTGASIENITFFQIASLCVFKLKDSKIVFGLRQTQQHSFILFYYENMFPSIVHHQAIVTKLSTRYKAVPILFVLRIVETT